MESPKDLMQQILDRKYQELLIEKHNKRQDVLNATRAAKREMEIEAERAYVEALTRIYSRT